MADIEVQPLAERLSDEEIEELAGALESVGAPRLPRVPEDMELTIAEGIDDKVLEDLLDRLEALDAACDIYLPIEFDGPVQVGDLSVGSLPALLEALDELKDELSVDEGDADDEDESDEADEDEDADDVLAGKLRAMWKLVWKGATEATERVLPLHLVG